MIKVFFANDKVQKLFENLKTGNNFDKILYKQINNAIKNIKQSPFYGIRIKRDQIPKEYSMDSYTSIFKYDLPKGWRLIYSISRNDIEIYGIIIEWFDHKNYEKRFGYVI